MVGCFLSKKEYGVKDLSTIAYGMALALMLPAVSYTHLDVYKRQMQSQPSIHSLSRGKGFSARMPK